MYFDHIDHPIPQCLFPGLPPLINVIFLYLEITPGFKYVSLYIHSHLQTNGNFSSENKENHFFTLK